MRSTACARASLPMGRSSPRTRGAGNARRGSTLTFSADKSVSAVWAVAGERLRTAIADAHTAAVQYTLEHVIEAHCATTRIRTRTLSGARGELAIVPADLIAALFQHGTSRADDPQLHTHCTVMNVARAHFDGKYRALNQYPLYRWKMAAGATYRNHLAWGLRALWVQGGAARQGRGVHPHCGRAARARGALVQAHRPD